MALSKGEEAEYAALEKEFGAAPAAASTVTLPASGMSFKPLTPAEQEEYAALEKEFGPTPLPPKAELGAGAAPVSAEGGRTLIDQAIENVGSFPGKVLEATGVVPESIMPTKTVEEGGVVNPKYEKLRDLYEAPELSRWFGEGTFKAFQALGATAGTDINETQKILKNLFPEAKPRIDGAYLIMKSPSTGVEYAWKPGFRRSDIARTIVAAGVPALSLLAGGLLPKVAASALGAVGAPAALTSAAATAARLAKPIATGTGVIGGIGAGVLGGEITQKMEAAAGGTEDLLPVVAGGVIGGLVPAIGAGVNFIRNYRGVKPPAPPPPGGPITAGALTPEEQVAQQAGRVAVAEQRYADAAAALTPEARAAAETQLAQEAAEREKAALQGAFKNDMREIDERAAQAAANVPTRAALAREAADAAAQRGTEAEAKAALAAEATQKADEALASARQAATLPPSTSKESQELAAKGQELLTRMAKGGDKSSLNDAALRELDTAIKEPLAKAVKTFKKVDAEIGNGAVNPSAALEYLQKISADFNGPEGLPSDLQAAWKLLTPKKGDKEGQVLPVTYNILDMLRKKYGFAQRGVGQPGVEKALPARYAKGLYEALRVDQLREAERLGGRELADALKEGFDNFALGKDLQKKAVALLGKQGKEALVGDVMEKVYRPTTKLAKGFTGDFFKTIDRLKGLSPETKSDVLMATVGSSFGDVASGQPVNLGAMGQWYEQLKGQKAAYNAFTSNITPEAKELLENTYQVAQAMKDVVEREGLQSAEEKAAKKLALKTAEKDYSVALRASNTANREAASAVKALKIAKNKAKELEAKAAAGSVRQEGKIRKAEYLAELKPLQDKVDETTRAATEAKTALRRSEVEKASFERGVKEETARLAKEAKEARKKAGGLRKTAGRTLEGAGWTMLMTGPRAVGVPAIAAGKVIKSEAFGKLLDMVPLKRIMDVAGVPKSQRQQWLERSLSAWMSGTPVGVED